MPVFHTPSKKSKVKDDLALPQRLEETPTRGSLAKLLAAARLSDSDSQNDGINQGPPSRAFLIWASRDFNCIDFFCFYLLQPVPFELGK